MSAPRPARLSLSLSLVCMAVGAPATARAHPLLDEAAERYRQADFEGALSLFARAEGADDLSRGELVELYRARSLVHLALGDEAAAEADLERLARLEPAFAPPPEMPPAWRALFDAVRARVDERLAVEASVQRDEDAVEIRARAVGDPMQLVRSLRVHARAGERPWQLGSDGSLRLPAAPGALVRYYVDAFGPGGAVLASLGSEAAPERVAPRPRVAEPAPAPVAGGSDDTAWWVVGALTAAAIVAAVTVVLVVVLGGPSDETRFSGPTVAM